MNTKLTNAYIKERVLLNLQIRELEQKARKLLKNYGTPSYYAEGHLILSAVKMGRVAVVDHESGWGVALDGTQVLSYHNDMGDKIDDGRVQDAIDEIDRLTVLDRIAEV